MSTVTIFHNPACGTSRSTLALIRQRGIELGLNEPAMSDDYRQPSRRTSPDTSPR